MQHIIRREAITTARQGTRIPLARLCREIAERTADPAVATAAAGEAELIDDDLLCRLLLGQLQAVGLFGESAPRLTLGDELRRWLDESVRQLRERGHLTGDPRRPRPAHPISSRDVWTEWEERSAQWTRNADLRAQVVLLDAMLRALPRILTGEVLATDVMFPDSSMALVEGIYKNNPVTDCFNGVMAEAVAGAVREILRTDPAARVRILEIGAGTGGGSVKVFEKLEPYAAHVETYSYTDLSKSFLMYAEKEYGPKHPYLDYRIFNVEAPLATQDVEPGSYDIVLATNVLHATRNIRRTLRNAKATLKANGVLLANELSSHSMFTHLTFGLLEGWWLYEDDELRIPGCPGLAPESWADVLEDEGFDSVSFPARRLHDLGHQVIAADSDGLIRQDAVEPEAPGGAAEQTGAEQTGAEPAGRAPRSQRPARRAGAVPDEVLEEHVKDVVFEQLKLSLKVDRTQIAADDAFMDYGIDSIIGVQLIQEINRKLGIDLATTDLFDHGSVNRLARHVVAAHRAEALASLPAGLRPAAEAAEPLPEPGAEAPTTRTATARPAAPAAAERVPARPRPEPAAGLRKEPIAIVGMSGRFGGSPDVERLWEHLAQGDDLIEKVSRWDLSGLPESAGDCDRGSFVDDIDRFDPTFFNISGVEATYMDPQQRLFLEEAWKALEDAGYAGSTTQGRQVGVYVGCQESGYAQLFGGEAPPQSMWGNSLSALPARISYYLDLQGPAVAVDTACSSSLVAIHLACQGLWGGETGMAIAGGVALQATPQFYLLAGQAGMLSPTGRCHTFDERADGFVPGEGVGVVVLKRLSDALADGDHVHGVISGTGINQDGASNGITAPSARSQERLETAVYDAFGINPEHIQLVEAHGTGTKLGDPIEYHALKRAFRRYTTREGYCALGSVKSNLGHTITAAGVAGVLKVLLSLRHRRIPPSINYERGNPHIDTAGSPFYVNTENRPWEAGGDGTRRAAVSSFGVSGTNAHLVIEEAPLTAHRDAPAPADLLVLSAGTAEQLTEQVRRLLAHAERHPELDLGDTAFTLLTGRRHLSHRLAVVARDQDDLVRGLRLWLEQGRSSLVCTGEVPAQGPTERAALRNFGNDCLHRATTETDPETLAEYLATVADLFVQGYGLDYAALFTGRGHRRVPLPTYPFARDRYWVPQAAAPRAAAPAAGPGAAPHPLLHADVSDFATRRHESVFTGEEHFLKDHVVKGRKVLPGVACLEMARAAGTLALGGPAADGIRLTLRNVAWARPVTAEGSPVTLTTSLRPTGRDEAAFEITGTDGDASGAPVVHSQGLVLRRAGAPAVLDLAGIRAACDRGVLEAARLYPAYEAIGFSYGDSHKGIERLHIGRDQVLVRLVLPASVRDTRDAYVLHPSILDATLQASLGLGAAGGADTLDVSGTKPSLPFALDELEVLGACTEEMWAWIRYSAGVERDSRVFKLDIDLCDRQGEVRVRIRGMSYRVLEGEVGRATADAPSAEVSAVTFLPAWRPVETGAAAAPHHPAVVLVPDLPDLADALERRDPAARVIRLSGGAGGPAERFTAHAEQTLAHVQRLAAEAGSDPRTLVQLVVPEAAERVTAQGLLGLLKTAQAEAPGLLAQAVLVDPAEDADTLADRIGTARRSSGEPLLRFRDGRAEALTWVEGGHPTDTRVPWRNGGVYLLTGGLGGIGTVVAGDMVDAVRELTLVLVGRSAPSPEQEAVLDGWRARGADVRYERLDVADAAGVRDLVERIHHEHGALHGIVHGAGVIRDGLLRGRTAEQCREVLAPKVAGLVNLDEASKDLDLDFLVAFSGLAGVFGNTGQADYAAANAFMDAYQAHRQELVARGERRGASVSVDWPLWAEGGMRVDRATEELMHRRLGMAPMPSGLGLGALYAALDAPHTQVLVVAGDVERVRRTVLHREEPQRPTAVPVTDSAPAAADRAAAVPAAAPGGQTVRDALIGYLRDTLAEVIRIPAHRIDPGAPFDRFGIDSVLALTVTNRLEADFGSLSKTLFFEHQSIEALSAHFLAEHAGALTGVLGARVAAPEASPAPQAPAASPAPQAPAASPAIEAPVAAVPAVPASAVVPAVVEPVTATVTAQAPAAPAPAGEDAIAVIGLAGRYPGAADPDELWQNLLAGRDGITEVPADRWAHGDHYDPEPNRPGRTPTKWGGFLDDVAGFDSLFFHVSPREAAITDPQTRLFLECVWNLLERSGYTRDRLREAHGSKVGVYVGAMYQHYQLLASDPVHESITSVMSYSAIANRVSHFFDLQGPSVAVDSTCSSSLVAIHLACEELRRGSCEMMIAGGVNLTIHPKKYLGLSLTGLTGSSPDSRAFLDGDGFLPAEGVGAVLLKPLSRAVADGDEILAVIRSSATNHKGRTNGPMVPSPDRQAELIDTGLRRAGVHPRTVGYVEASANGSQMGDALEFAALKKAFGAHTRDEGFCAIGTVKSNLGNLEAASGVAQLSKVVLQLRHRRLVPFVGEGELNPGVRLDGTPFRLPREAGEWHRPVVDVDGQRREYPRRATISGFGAGGSNAFLVVEEYCGPDRIERPAAEADGSPQVIVLSARTEDRLRAVAGRLRAYVGARPETDLADLAHTLQYGREPMESRLALVAAGRADLLAGLDHFLAGTGSTVPLFTGDTRRDDSELGVLLGGRVGDAVLRELLAEARPDSLALFWARGGAVPWEQLPRTRRPRLLRDLPTYPFDRRRHWVTPGREPAPAPASALPAPALPAPVAAPVAAAAATGAAERIAGLVGDLLGVPADALDPDAPLEDLGLSSILATQLLHGIRTGIDPDADAQSLADCRSTRDLQRRFGAATPADAAPATPADAATPVDAAAASPASPVRPTEAVRLNGVREGRPVFWFHGGMGGVEVYTALADSVQRPFYGIQARGWMSDSAPLQGIPAMAEHYVDVIRSVQPEGPYDLGGYSLGGLLAYEVTRRLQERGERVDTVVMVDSMYGDAVKSMTMARTDMVLQGVNALLFAAAKPAPGQFGGAFVAAAEVDWLQDDDTLLDRVIGLARERGLRGSAEALRAVVEQNVRVQEAYLVLDYDVLPLPRAEEVTCFYFRNGSGLFFGDLEAVFSTRGGAPELDHAEYWTEWEKQLPDFHRADVESSNHFVMLGEERSLSAIRSFCKVCYSGAKDQRRVAAAKAWMTRRRRAAERGK
ncbi:SDR family NAD(P)-dependent oxidoreductase [Kitasatospora sp. NPDC086791]|uniref:SDR family NAD(P)-dependent oxidoreductase n=1 Tax=Kitasatospora sp. NPDC086791 TaxID=3155178 RepID=UPI003446271A